MRALALISFLSLSAVVLFNCGDGSKPPATDNSGGPDTSTGDKKDVEVVDANIDDGSVEDAGAEAGSFTIGGTVSGLLGTGLVLHDANANLAISADGAFTFIARTPGPYDVSVLTQPDDPTQECVVTDGKGTATSDVSSIAVTCTTKAFQVGGTVSGLKGIGLTLRNNGGDDLVVGADGGFNFATTLDSGTEYEVSIASQPTDPKQTCKVTSEKGKVGAGDVSTVLVNCSTDKFAVSGLIAGLDGTVILQNNGGDDLSVSSEGSFTFSKPIASGAKYAVTVLTQPGIPSQTCEVTDGTGTVGASDVSTAIVQCTTNAFKVGGKLTNLAADSTVVLQNNGRDNLTLTANGDFTFDTSVDSDETYEVTVLNNPSAPIAQRCTVTVGTGKIAASDVKTVLVDCVTQAFKLSVNVSGLAGPGLVVQNNLGDNLPVLADGDTSFATTVLSGDGYNVTVLNQPTNQGCVVSSPKGVMGGAEQFVAISCYGNTCADLLTTSDVWGLAAQGLDIGKFTSGTLDWIGCPDDDCDPTTFFCTDETAGIFFGVPAGQTLRSLVDPGNSSASYPASSEDCCSITNPRDICNAPTSQTNPAGTNPADAMCKAMGFKTGTIVAENLSDNACPRPHSTTSSGSDWTSTFSQSDLGYGYQYRCAR